MLKIDGTDVASIVSIGIGCPLKIHPFLPVSSSKAIIPSPISLPPCPQYTSRHQLTIVAEESIAQHGIREKVEPLRRGSS
jgi:hypothetical protein